MVHQPDLDCLDEEDENDDVGDANDELDALEDDDLDLRWFTIQKLRNRIEPIVKSKSCIIYTSEFIMTHNASIHHVHDDSTLQYVPDLLFVPYVSQYPIRRPNGLVFEACSFSILRNPICV